MYPSMSITTKVCNPKNLLVRDPCTRFQLHFQIERYINNIYWKETWKNKPLTLPKNSSRSNNHRKINTSSDQEEYSSNQFYLPKITLKFKCVHYGVDMQSSWTKTMA